MNIDVAQMQAFHGHMCPGLAMDEHPGDEEVVAIVETNSCAVDAVQFITGCTFGEKNFVHLDQGMNAFRFIRRKDINAICILVRPQAMSAPGAEQEQLMKRWRAGAATEDEKQQAKEIRPVVPPRSDFQLGCLWQVDQTGNREPSPAIRCFMELAPRGPALFMNGYTMSW
jgi:formylmethanofuran dehydrogenase subunit E